MKQLFNSASKRDAVLSVQTQRTDGLSQGSSWVQDNIKAGVCDILPKGLMMFMPHCCGSDMSGTVH